MRLFKISRLFGYLEKMSLLLAEDDDILKHSVAMISMTYVNRFEEVNLIVPY